MGSVSSSLGTISNASSALENGPGCSYSSVESDLHVKYGTQAYEIILKTSCFKEVVYCKHPVQAIYGTEDNPQRTPTSVNHDFLVLEITAKGTNDQDSRTFFIKAEKVGGWEAGVSSGIYVRLLEEEQVGRISDWRFYSWDCGSAPIPVPLNAIIKILENQDPKYTLLFNNCQHYAKAACKSVLLLLSEQPILPPNRSKSYWENEAQTVATKIIALRIGEVFTNEVAG